MWYACATVRLASVAALLCASAGVLSAQFQFNVWTADDGLPQNIFRDLLQTPDGYLWAATLDGLVRFDGVRFVVFNRANSLGMANNRILCLYLDHDGDMWLGTEGGITRLHSGTFRTFTTQDGLPNNLIQGIHGDESGRLWALVNGTVAEWDKTAERFQAIDPGGDKLVFRNDRWSSRGGFWASGDDALYHFERGKLKRFPIPRWLAREDIPYVADGGDGNIWLWTSRQQTWKLKASGNSEPERIGNNEGRLRVPGSRHAWDFSVSPQMIRAIESRSAAGSRKVEFVTSLEDREGNLWLGTDGQGLYQVTKQAIRVYTKEDGLASRNVYPMLQDHTGAVWIGTWGSGISRLHAGKFTTFDVRSGLQSGLITSLYEDRSGTLWAGSHVSMRILHDGRFVPPKDEILPRDGFPTVIHQDRGGDMWFGWGGGVARYRRPVVTRYTIKDGLAGDDTRAIIDAADGGVWIGGYGGLTHFRDGHFTRWTDRDGLPSNSVRALYLDWEGVLWIGTYDGGLGRLSGGKLTRYTIREGLFNNGVFQILEDVRGNLWMSSNRGIYRVSKRDLNEYAEGRRKSITSVAYGKADGMANVECNGGTSPAGFIALDGKLWFPTQNGAAVVDPESVTWDTQPPPVVIESASIERQAVPLQQPLRIQPGQDDLEVAYTALTFVNPENVKFRYRIDGLNREWTEAGNRRTANFSRLPPGDYTFRVIAANRDGVWNEQGSSLAFSVLAPFYQRGWFLFLSLGLIGGTVSTAWRLRVARLRRTQAAHQAFSRQLIASQENERKRIAAELHDSLGARLVIIKNLAMLCLQDNGSRPDRQEQVEEICAEASRAIGEVREISYDLRPYQLDRLGLTKALESIVKTASMAGTASFSARIDDVDKVLPAELEINVYRIVQESVNNIIKHSAATEATVTVTRQPPRLVLRIEDNGKGIDANSDRKEGGFGLVGIRERAELLGGWSMIESSPGKGTTIRIEIPLAGAQV